MNANELADEWKHTAFISEENKQNCGDRMAVMLRQLQAENEELRAKLGCDPAYFDMPARKLTDEEILELTKDSAIFEYREFDDDMIRFAKAILRKAQEK